MVISKIGVSTITEQILKAVTEVSYLNMENTWRYRAILRYFYQQHERLRHFLFPSEILEALRQNVHFRDYTEEQLQQDLQKLVEWKNLISRQETANVSSIEEFKKKKFRYQCTPYTVEIERLVMNLEQMGESFGGSLESSLFEKLLRYLQELDQLLVKHELTNEQSQQINKAHLTKQMKKLGLSPDKLYELWDDLYQQFRKLTENATDYLAHLKSEKVEEMMLQEAFLVYKDGLTQYLRNFMAALQKSALKIENILGQIRCEDLHLVLQEVAEYEMSIPRLERSYSQEELIEQYHLQWGSICSWFLGIEGQESDLIFLQNETNDTIRRITRFAQRLGERHHNFRSRRQDYLYLANWFSQTFDLKEAHKLSACVFGVMTTRHLFADVKQTEDLDADIWEQEATKLITNPRIRQYKEKTRAGAIVDQQANKDKARREYLAERELEQKLLAEIVVGQAITLQDLPTVAPFVRKTILKWIAKAMSNNDRKLKTEAGQLMQLYLIDDQQISLHAEDGTLSLPNYQFKLLN